MKTLILTLCLAATPAAAQVIIEAPNSEHPARDDRDRDREHPNLHEDRQQNFRDEDRRDRDHSDDEPDVMLIASGKHFRKAGGDRMETHGTGAGAGKVQLARPPRYRTGPHMLNPQPLPPG